MNFGFNDEQELLRSTARKFFDNECPSTTVRALMEDSSGMTPELWKKLAEQGWLGLIAPEEHGGMALGIVDLVVLLEEMGRAVVPDVCNSKATSSGPGTGSNPSGPVTRWCKCKRPPRGTTCRCGRPS